MNHLLLLILSSLTFSINSKTYNCVHDELYREPLPHADKKRDEAQFHHIHGREMATASRLPIRITLDTSDFDFVKQAVNGATTSKATYLQFIKRAMQVTEAFFEARLQVTQAARIYAPSLCYTYETPQNDRSNGIASSDLHIYVRYVSDKSILYGATGIACANFTGKSVPDSTFIAGRPTVGLIIFNTYTLLEESGITTDQALLTNRRFSSITATAIHQTMHILGFSNRFYSTYLNPNSVDGSYYPAGTMLSTAAKLHGSRPNSVLIKTPSVTAWAKDFFGCDSLSGMQLQNQDASTPGSHWQRAIMYDQLMTGTSLGAQKGISGASFALLKDMGWYKVQDRFYDYTNYGYKKGCNFFNNICYDSVSLPKYFCNAKTMSELSDCSSDFLGKSQCKMETELMADGCSMWVENHHCVDPDQGDDGLKQYSLEVYGTKSFCVKSNFGTSPLTDKSTARCYPYTCSYETGVQAITFTVGNFKLNCLSTESGKVKKISSMAGELECPNFDDFCTNSRKICKNWCSQNGICTRGVCNCLPGYSGQDCSKTICTSDKYYNPTDNTCGVSCPSGTYQNIFSKTCLPCDSQCEQCINEPTICSSCHSTVSNPQVYYNGVCLSKCPDGTFQLRDTCENCNEACKTCFGSATNCTSCQSPKLLSEPNNGTCGTSCPNPVYSLEDRVNGICINTCKDNLIEGVDSVDISIKTCQLCPVDQFKWISDKDCHRSCEPGYYPNSTERFCKMCHSSCLNCEGSYAQNCTKCKSNSENKYFLLNMCVSSCPAGYYANDVRGQCQVCPAQLYCATCYINSSDSKVYCSTCKYEYYLQSNFTCLKNCDKYKYQNKWNHSCDACSSSCGDCTSPSQSSCTNCRTNMLFLSNQTGGYCLTSCPTLNYVKTGTNCLSCHKTCLTCNGVTSANCHSCVSGLYLYSGYCRYVCPQKTYPDKDSASCKDCDSKCRFCFGPTVDNCTSCETNLVLNNFTCSTSCPTNYTINQWNVCVKFEFHLNFLIYSVAMLVLIIFHV